METCKSFSNSFHLACAATFASTQENISAANNTRRFDDQKKSVSSLQKGAAQSAGRTCAIAQRARFGGVSESIRFSIAASRATEEINPHMANQL